MQLLQNGENQQKNAANIQTTSQLSILDPRRALIVSKTSLLEYEFKKPKKGYTDFNDERFIRDLRKKYTNPDELKQRHEQQQQYINAISQELKRHNIEWRVVRRREYTEELVSWSDLVISAGGDGTFLTAAKGVPNGQKPVIGINTDPIGSEGFLCLTGKSRHPADEVIHRFLTEAAKPNFDWMLRQRIRVTVLNPGIPEGVTSSESSSSIQAQRGMMNGEVEKTEEQGATDTDDAPYRKSKFSSDDEDESTSRTGHGQKTIPILALNEVFIGESHAARVSYYDVQVDNGPMTKQKSSGMTICTGTGSTSWHYNINRMTEQTLVEILGVMSQMGLNMDQEVTGEMVERICRQFNDKLKFRPELQKMAFSVRDPVFNATFPKTPIRGFCEKILLKSRCTDAHLILDGSTSIPFNRGTEVLLEIHPEDALRTAVFSEEYRS